MSDQGANSSPSGGSAAAELATEAATVGVPIRVNSDDDKGASRPRTLS